MTDSRKFILNTDYPLDKIVFMYSGSQTVNNNTYSGTITIMHNLGFRPLAKMQWSNTSDFDITNEHGDNQYFTNIFSTQEGQDYSVTSTDTTVSISLYNTSGSNKTLYYRIYCFAPSDISEETVIAGTSSSADKFVISTDYNYMKLAFEGYLTAASPTFTHNLGYVPRVLIWQRTGSITDDYTYSIEAPSYQAGVHVTSTQLVSLNQYVDRIHYRIYADE